jgi:serine protease Do
MDELYPPPRPQTPRSSGLPWLLMLLAVLAAVLFLPALVERVYYSMTLGRERALVDSARSQLPSPTLTEISRQFAVVAKAIEPSVVHIDTVQSGDGTGAFDASLGPQAIGQGSGVIIDEDGYILTNNHVVENASEIRVNLSGNESRQAEVVGLDETTDLAVLKIPSGGLIPAQWGDSDALEIGSLVWAVGNPFGLDRSVTLGIVSAKNRRRFRGMSPYQDFLQTDAAINPGNSGGPLVDVSGKVVGINTAIVGRSYQGVSFSIPTSIAKEVYERLRENGKVTRGFMGVTLGDLTAELAEKAGISSLAGAVVLGIGPGTPAAKAGIQLGDVIVSWDGQPVHDATELTLLVGKTKIGETVKVKILRDGKPLEVDLQVEERPGRMMR